jgi:hypothetical protein
VAKVTPLVSPCIPAEDQLRVIEAVENIESTSASALMSLLRAAVSKTTPRDRRVAAAERKLDNEIA